MTCIVTALICLEMQYFVSNANFVFTASFLAPYISLRNSIIIVNLPKIGLAPIYLAGGLGDLRLLRYELRKRLFFDNLLFDHVYLILPFLANTCRHSPISVKSTSTGRSLLAIITSTAQPRSSFQHLNSASALSLTSPLKHCWYLSRPERLRIAYFKLLFIEKISPILISLKHAHNSP